MRAEQLEFRFRRRLARRRHRGRRPVKEEQPLLPVGDPFYVPPGDFPRPGLVDAAFAQHVAERMRDAPNALPLLCQFLAGRLRAIEDIDRVYRGKLNEWAARVRERAWMEHFTAEAIIARLSAAPVRVG
jgi:hypothetical protein